MEDRYSFASEYGLSEDRVVDVSAGICPLGPSRKVRAAIRQSIRRIRNLPDQECRKLRRFFLSRFGIAGDSLCFSNSLKELLHSVIAVTRPGKVLISGPALPLYEDVARAAGADILYVQSTSEDGFAIDPQNIIDQMDGMDLVIIANPNRITGRAVGEDALLKIMSASAGKNIRICLDESLMDFAAGPHSFSPGNQHLDSLIILRTTAFFYGLPGLEIAYGIAHPLIAGAVHGLQTSPPGILSVEAALTAFKDAVYSREVRDFMGSEKAWFMRSLRKIERVTCHDSDANVFLLRTEDPSEALVNFLGQSGFFIKHCGDIIGLGPDFLRCSVIRHDKAVKFLRLLKGRLQNVRVAH